ncbi:MAG: hypothetical protein WDO15_27850 [Bacteroidota bacterium]
MRKLLVICFVLISACSFSQNWKKINVLVYTKNGKGYVHDNIPFAVEALKKTRSRTWLHGSSHRRSFEVY